MENSNKMSLSTTRTKAIQCEVLSNSPVSNSNSWKFITPTRLQKAIKEAKYDLHHMLEKSAHVNYPLETPICSKKRNAKNVMSIPPNLSLDQEEQKRKAKSTIHKPTSHPSCYKDLPFSEEKKHTESNSCVSTKSSSSITTPDLQSQELENNEGLNEADLKWFGKNYRTQLSRKATISNTDFKSHISNKCSLHPQSSIATHKRQNQIQVHKTVIDLVNRVQVREQQLRKQLAEMSFTPAPSVSSTRSSLAEESHEPILLSNLPKELNIFVEGSFKRDCTETSSTQHSDEMLMSAESLISLLGDEWLKNLLKEELEISHIE
ncbi:uncharacterized protein LOC130688546 [Daphnia carinata]|uniref:uncharacterized protein LOC130688546 n=1 Tax=Daphnia carinata TaxID=120202 RepID=UPI00257E08B5|nr:uncharacterized protein LOC130688546 [Daphnia carinata]